MLPRGGGTSQSGQTVGHSLVIDCSKHLDRIVELDAAGQRCVVEPGIVLDDLNRQLKQHGLWYPVDVSTASRATIGGMAANNSCGGRSLRYGTMRDNVLSIDATLADGVADARAPAPEARLDAALLAAAADRAMTAALTPLEKLVLQLLFGLGGAQVADGAHVAGGAGDRTVPPLDAVGRRLGLTRERVRQIELRALKKLRDPRVSHHLRPWHS